MRRLTLPDPESFREVTSAWGSPSIAGMIALVELWHKARRTAELPAREASVASDDDVVRSAPEVVSKVSRGVR